MMRNHLKAFKISLNSRLKKKIWKKQDILVPTPVGKYINNNTCCSAPKKQSSCGLGLFRTGLPARAKIRSFLLPWSHTESLEFPRELIHLVISIEPITFWEVSKKGNEGDLVMSTVFRCDLIYWFAFQAENLFCGGETQSTRK